MLNLYYRKIKWMGESKITRINRKNYILIDQPMNSTNYNSSNNNSSSSSNSNLIIIAVKHPVWEKILIQIIIIKITRGIFKKILIIIMMIMMMIKIFNRLI